MSIEWIFYRNKTRRTPGATISVLRAGQWRLVARILNLVIRIYPPLTLQKEGFRHLLNGGFAAGDLNDVDAAVRLDALPVVLEWTPRDIPYR